MYGGNFPDIGKMISILLGTVVVLAPLAIWKLVEILYWVYSHIHWS